MLQSIYIDNYALIDKLEIKLDAGLSIITGETGAGKSILLGALGLLLGKRVDTTVLRNGERKCVVEGTFNLAGYELEITFRNHDLEYHEETIIRREISISGKSRAFINDTPVTLSVLSEICLNLIDIHSQHQNLSLNSEEYIRWILDSYAGTRQDVKQLGLLYSQFADLAREYSNAEAAYREEHANLDLLTHQFNELKEAGLKEGELAELEMQSELLSHADEIKTSLENAGILLHADDMGILQSLKTILDQLGRVAIHVEALKELHARIESVYIELKDIDDELIHQSEKVDLDPQRMDWLNRRIDMIHTLLNKYKVESEAELIILRDKLDERLQDFALGDHKLEALKKARDEKKTEAHSLAGKISSARNGAFETFQNSIQAQLINLGMKDANFEVQCEKTELGPTGIDKMQFLFSANKNVAIQQIARVASGGELSRLMLAIKYLISGAAGLPVIIFDEIDTGVSGEIADKVGDLIKGMAGKMQVLNITHLPQVASKGDHHFMVYKDSSNGHVNTRIRKLDEKERLNEIARMLSGDSVTDAAIENARVLLKR